MPWRCCLSASPLLQNIPTNTPQPSQKRSHTVVMLRPTREPQEDGDSPDPAEIKPNAVGTCPVPAGGGRALSGKQGWDFHPQQPLLPPQLPAVQGWVPGLVFQQHLAPALPPLFLAEDETRCSCDAGAETLEVCKDSWGREEGERKKKSGSSWRSWLPQSASQVAQLTPCLPSRPLPLIPVTSRELQVFSVGEKGCRRCPGGSRGRVQAPRLLFCRSGSAALLRGRRAFDSQLPPHSLSASFCT